MPGNDLSATRALIPSASTTQATSRANISTVLTNLLNDIEPKVTPSGLDMTSALSFLSGGVYSAITDAGYMHFEDRTSGPAVNESVYVLGDELYFRDGNGNDVGITSGGSVNAAAGNVTGAGYGTPVEINWDTGTAEYRMKASAGAHGLADVVLDRARFSDGTNYYATLGAQAGMAATLAFSLPIAFPASTSAMTLTSTGLMASTRDLDITSYTAPTSAGFKCGQSTRYIHASAGFAASAGTWTMGNSSAELDVGVAGNEWYIPIDLRTGERLVSVVAFISGGDGATKTGSVQVKAGGCDGTAATDLVTPVTNVVTGETTITISAINYTQGTSGTDPVFFRFDTGHTSDRISHIAVVYDVP